MFIIANFCFLVKQGSSQLLSDFLRTGRTLIFLDFLSFSSQTPLLSSQPSFSKLTFLHPQGIRNLNALAYSGKKWYLCIEMSGKGSISRMSDECLITLETVVSFYVVYQAVMRKFTLARKARYPSKECTQLSKYLYFRQISHLIKFLFSD